MTRTKTTPPRPRTHAWVDALLPGLGWVGFDPTNNLTATGTAHPHGDRPRLLRCPARARNHERRRAPTELQVRVRVTPSEAVLPPDEELASDEEWSRFLEQDREAQIQLAQQQQQQQ